MVSELTPDLFGMAVFRELSSLEEPKPGTVARILLPLLLDAKLGRIPEPNTKVYFLEIRYGRGKVTVFILDSNEFSCYS